MQFLSPLYLIGLAAVAVPLALHLFRRRADPIVPFSAVRLLRRAPVEQARRRRLRDLLLLALRVAAVALLALSFARPYLASARAAAAAPLTIVAIDTSYSVSSPDQVRRARTLARAAVSESAAGPVALVRFDSRAEIAAPPTLDRGAVLSAIDATVAGAAATRYGAALGAAADLAGGRPARLVFVTDLQQRGWVERSAAALPAAMQVEVRDVGAAKANLAVTALERTADGAIARVRNDGTARRSTTAILAIDGHELARQPLDVEAGTLANAQFRVALPPRGALRASIDDPGGYQADDERYAVLDRAGAPRVLVVTGEGPTAASSVYIEAALSAVNAREFDVVRWRPRSSQGDRPLEGSAAILLLGTYGVDRATLDAIGRAAAAGTGLLVVGGPAIEPPRLDATLPSPLDAVRAEALPDASMAPADPRHPAFRALEGNAAWLATTRFTRAIPLGGARGARVLARFSTGAPALVEYEGRARVLVLASDLSGAWNDLALHPAFVPFVHGLIRYAAASGAGPVDLHVGDLPEISRAGVSEVRGRRVAVNVDPAEGDPARMSPAAFLEAVPRTGVDAASAPRAALAEREREQSLWRYGLMLMLGALVVESAVGRRA